MTNTADPDVLIAENKEHINNLRCLIVVINDFFIVVGSFDHIIDVRYNAFETTSRDSLKIAAFTYDVYLKGILHKFYDSWKSEKEELN